MTTTLNPIENTPFSAYANTVYIVIPAYNESRILSSVLTSIAPLGCSVVVVDDASTDKTGHCVHAPNVSVIRHVVNRGQGAALQTGITYALRNGAQYIVTYDADGQHSAEDIPRLVGAVHAGETDIALGSRFLGVARNMPCMKWVILKLAIVITWIVSGVKLSDVHNGFRVFSRRAAEKIDIHCDRMAHASEIIDQIQTSEMSFREYPVTISYTPYSREKEQGIISAIHIFAHYSIRRIFR